MPGQPAYRGLYTYAWDLADEGVAEVAARARDAGANTLTLAAAYHAGKFIRPHGVSGKVYFPEDGTVYFRHGPERYGRVKPLPPRSPSLRTRSPTWPAWPPISAASPGPSAATTPVSACSTPTSSPATASATR